MRNTVIIAAVALIAVVVLLIPTPSLDYPASGAVEPDVLALAASGTPVKMHYATVRQLVPYEVPQLPDLLLSSRYSPFQCGPLEDILGDGILRQNPASFTNAERLLAFGWKNPKASDFWDLSHDEQLEYMNAKRNRELGNWLYLEFNPARDTLQLWWKVLNLTLREPRTVDDLFDYSLWGNALREPDREFIDELLCKFTSPVTGKFIEFKCQEFSRGNMYITYIPDEIILEHQAVFDLYWEPRVRPEPEGVVYMYYRVYGTTGVIRSGIFFGVPNREGLLMGRS